MNKLTAGIFCLLLFCTSLSFAQITASQTSGCAPLVGVQFNGISGSSNILWNFQDGTTASVLNPVHTFAAQGTYNVTYSATVSGSPVNQSITINVFGRPSPAFVATTPVSGCIPLTVSFDDNSTGGGGSAIVGWSWAFGDGGVNTTNTPLPVYTYTLPGTFSVSLIVTDANGCDSSMVITDMIKTSPKPIPVITTTPSPASSCTAPLTVQFNGASSVSNSTTGSTALTYSWDLANGTSSTLVSPAAVTYTAVGVYPVKLTVTDNNNCTDSVVLNVTIQTPHASFAIADTVCRNVTFTNNSTLGTYVWNYGDGQTGASPSHTYTAAGTYNVTLTVTAGTCVDDTTRTIVVEQPVANFTYSPSYYCSLPGAGTFTNTSTGAATYSWSFNDGSNQFQVLPTTSTVANPGITLTDLDTNRYTIDHLTALLNVTLTVATTHGCTHTNVKNIIDTIFLPTARHQPDVTHGCAPLTVQFSDSSVSFENIVIWRYEFGDGTFATSGTIGDATHTYTQPGIYSPILIIRNSKGCIDTSYAINIYVGVAPHPDFTAAPLNVCAGDPVQFTSVFPPADSVDSWHFNTDGGTFMSSCPGEANPTWSFINSTGPQNVTLEACWRGCCATSTKTGYINVDGPMAHATVRLNCDTPYTYIFTAEIKDATSWVIQFGDTDSVATSSLTTFSHSYPARGDYVAVLSAFNNITGCAPSRDTIHIKVREIIARIGSDTATATLCSGSNGTFDATLSQDVQASCHGGYVWLWGDATGPTITDQPVTTHAYATGTYTAKLIVTDANGCRDTAQHLVKAYGITPAFTTSSKYFCIPDTISFNNTSTSDTTISNFQWTFGDGGTGTSTIAQPNTSHVYINAAADSFTVILTVNNVIGCTKTITRKIYPSKPIATFLSVNGVNKCAGDSVHFVPYAANNTAYNWNFGDASTSSLLYPHHAYASAGTYSVSLSVTDTIGCVKTSALNAYIKVQNYPNAGFISSADTATERCYPFVGLFSDTSQVNIFGSRVWDLGNGSAIVPSAQVGTVYQQPGSYLITLIETTTFGCSDTVSKTIQVEGPLADFSLSQTTICKGDIITFTIFDTTDVFTWHWDFGDGYDTTALSPIPHQYNFHPPGGTTNATLVFWSDDSTCVKTLSKPINISQVIADFDRNNELTKPDTAHCIGLTDVFTNTSINATSLNWNFGDGATSTTSVPSHLYTAPGIYNVSLNISSSIGCVDTLKKQMVIYALPNVIARGGDTCAGKSIQISASGGEHYVWTPSSGLSNDTIPNPFASPSATSTYTVTVTDSNGCTSSASVDVYIQQEPPQYVFDTTIVIGSSVNLVSTTGSGYTYSWTPSDSLSCVNCPNPTSGTLTDIKYVLTISDTMGCFSRESYYDIYVKPVSSVDVPSAFTPNGDGVNDIIYVDGWGIKRLIEFKIYNRWGELIFETNDLKQGWDGTFRGIPQNIETYVYQAKVETYIDAAPITKKGHIKLLR